MDQLKKELKVHHNHHSLQFYIFRSNASQ